MLDQNKHRKILNAVLVDIYSQPEISPLLGFKGGTALYLFYGLNRFSVDLDFDLLDPSKEEEVYKSVLEIVSEYGTIKDQALKRFGGLIAVSYETGLHHLKLDISNRQTSAKYEVKRYLGIPMRVMALEDMAANKLIALTDRKKPAARDVFDLHFILKNNINFNEALIQERAELSLIEQLKKTINHLEENFDFNLLEALGELVDEKQKSWVKNKMKEETLMRLRIHLDSLEQCL